MRYQKVVDSIVNIFSNAEAGKSRPTIYLESAPGTGKTTMAYVIAEKLGIPEKNIHIFRPSLHDPVDLVGIPSTGENTTTWLPPDWLYQLSDDEKHLVVWDELPQAITMMQNAIAGALLDKEISGVKFGPNVFQIATGNRVSDKAGANRLLGQVSNRMIKVTLDPNIHDWTDWALQRNIRPDYVAWLNARPEMLMNYDANKPQNATPRSHELAATNITDSLPDDVYLDLMIGTVGEAAAIDWMGFRKLKEKLPTYEEVVNNPKKTRVPSEPDQKYAVAALLATSVKKETIEKDLPNLTKYVSRMTREFQILFIKCAVAVEYSLLNEECMDSWIEDEEISELMGRV